MTCLRPQPSDYVEETLLSSSSLEILLALGRGSASRSTDLISPQRRAARAHEFTKDRIASSSPLFLSPPVDLRGATALLSPLERRGAGLCLRCHGTSSGR